MLAAIVGFILKMSGAGVIDKVLDGIKARSDADTERRRIQSLQETNAANNQRDVIIAGMAHRVFWVAWSIAALPTAAWFGWGMADSLANGALPDVAALPPQLKGYADIVFGNIFYTGGIVAGVQVAARALTAKRS
jgi:hypothetical protein